jgi:hypothetical protein
MPNNKTKLIKSTKINNINNSQKNQQFDTNNISKNIKNVENNKDEEQQENKQSNKEDTIVENSKDLEQDDNNLEDNEKSKKDIIIEKKAKKGRPIKSVLYEKERKEILKKILNTLEISDENKIFFIEDIEKNEEKKKQICNTLPDVKKYFSCAHWTVILYDTPQPWLSLTRSVLKECKLAFNSLSLKDNTIKKIIKTGMLVGSSIGKISDFFLTENSAKKNDNELINKKNVNIVDNVDNKKNISDELDSDKIDVNDIDKNIKNLESDELQFIGPTGVNMRIIRKGD